ncbi:MAG: hypothetical protein NVS3B10_24380 [Polyangiales bacterium]
MRARLIGGGVSALAMFTLLACGGTTEDRRAGPSAASYPLAPFGVERGDVFPDGTLPGRDAELRHALFATRALYDPSGDRGVTGVLIATCALWCPACDEQLRRLTRWLPVYARAGGRFVSVLIEDAAGDPATTATLDAWIGVRPPSFLTAVDGGHLTAPNHAAMPRVYVVDPRTMQIDAVTVGVDAEATACATDADCRAGRACSVVFAACLDPASGSGPLPALDAVIARNGGAAVQPFAR